MYARARGNYNYDKGSDSAREIITTKNSLKKGQQHANEEMEEYPLEHTYNYPGSYLFSS